MQFFTSLRLKLFFYFLWAAFSVAGQTDYYPDYSWQIKSPLSLKINPVKLDTAIRFALRNETQTDTDLRVAVLKSYVNEPGYIILGPMKDRGKPAGVIIRNGYIAAQWGDIERVDMCFSASKSFLSTIAGLASDQKLIGNLNDKVNRIVDDRGLDGNHNSKITWKHLLHQTSDWSGCQFDLCDWADRPPKTGGIDDWKNRPLIEPGQQYEYNDVRVNYLAYLLLQVWRKPLPVVLKEKIMDPIQASVTWRWYGYDNSWVEIDGMRIQSVSGGGHFGGGMFINTLDMARFGLLFLRNGKWKEKSLISEDWVRSVYQGSDANPSYGLMWWNNKENALPGLPTEIFYANGYGGNYIVIDKAHDLVVVTRWLDSNKLGELMKLIVGAIEKE